MFVEKVHLKNFTVFRDCEINFSKGVNVIIGENGTGKTHLLKALYCFDEKFYEPNEENIGLEITNHDIIKLIKKENLYTKNSPSRDYPFNDINDLHRSMNSPLLLWEVVLNSGIALRPFSMVLDEYPPEDGDYSLLQQFEISANEKVYPLNKKFTYIPCKDILTHSRGFTALYTERNIPFEYVYFKILNKVMLPPLNKLDEKLKDIINKIENAIGGTVIQKSNVFFIRQKNSDIEIEFSMIAEGHKKLALLWLLIRNGEIDSNTILLFDEPEANLNPKLTGVIVDILLELSRLGCQIFVATHNNFIVEDFSIKSKKEDNVLYHSLYFNKDKSVNCETKTDPNLLLNNALNDKINEQYNATIEKVLGGDK